MERPYQNSKRQQDVALITSPVLHRSRPCNRVQHQKCVTVRFYDGSTQPTKLSFLALFMQVSCMFVSSSRNNGFGFVNRRSSGSIPTTGSSLSNKEIIANPAAIFCRP